MFSGNGKYDDTDKSKDYSDSSMYAYVNNYDFAEPRFTKSILKSKRYYKNLFNNRTNIDLNMDEAEQLNISQIEKSTMDRMKQEILMNKHRRQLSYQSQLKNNSKQDNMKYLF